MPPNAVDASDAPDTIAVQMRLRRALVTGPSMVPLLRHGDHVLVWLRPPRRLAAGSVVVVELPDATMAVKRLTRIEPDGAVWVLGDNAAGSTDSRQLGALPAERVRGVVIARLWPRPAAVRRRTPPGHRASSH
jgi:nickel-type superoxide dismutase maturation protease